MNLGQLGNMLMRLVMRRVVNIGIKKGVGSANQRGKAAKPVTGADAQQTQAAREMSERARQAARATRRLGR